MVDFWNFHDTVFLAKENWPWLLVALGLGIIVGWMTCSRDVRR
ncbi:MAG: hypothetical protein AB7F09_20490 [Parvibaculaceae bacterium]